MASAGYPRIVLVSTKARESTGHRERDDPADIIAVLDAFAEVFVEDVARNRGVTAERARGLRPRWRVRRSRRGRWGLADAMGDFEGLVASLQQRAFPRAVVRRLALPSRRTR